MSAGRSRRVAEWPICLLCASARSALKRLRALRSLVPRVPGRTDRGAILFEHGGEDLKARSQRQFQQLRLCVDEEIDQR
jgi:hypothetical protein